MVKRRHVIAFLILGVIQLFDHPTPGVYLADPTGGFLTTLLIMAAVQAAQYGLQTLVAAKRKVNPVDRGKLDDIRIQGNGYGEFIPRGYGVFRTAGTLIDATGIIHTTSTTPGRPGGKGTPKPPTPAEINHVYTTSLDIAVCEGLSDLAPDLKITRVWENITLIYDTTVTNQGDNLYEAEKPGNTLAGGATVVSDASASGGEAVNLPTNASVQWNDTYGTGGSAFLEFYYSSTAANTVDFDWNGSTFSDTLINSGGEYVLYRSAAFTLNTGFVNDLKIKNTHATDLKMDYLIIRISGQGTGAINPNLIQLEDEVDNLPYSGYLPQVDSGTGSTSGTLSAGGNVNFTVYTGTETQTANSTFAGINGAGNQPAYRGTVHVVFSTYQLKDPFVPNFSFEVNTGVVAIDDIVADLHQVVNLDAADLDVTALSGDALDDDEGFVITTRDQAQKWLNDLQTVYQFDMVEVDGKLKAIKRNGSSVATITTDELRGHWADDTPDDFECAIGDPDPALLPQVVEIGSLDPLLDYHQNVMPASRQSGDYQDPQTVNLPFILDASHARQLAETILYQRHMEARGLTFKTGPKYQKLHPGEVVTLSLTNATHVARIIDQKISIMGPIEFEAVRVQPSVYSQSVDGAGTGHELPVIPYVANTHGIIIDGPILRAEDAGDGTEPVVYIAGCQRGDGNWTGYFLHQEFPRDSGSFNPMASSDSQSGIGVATGTLAYVSDASVWDRINTVTINFYSNTTLESVTETQILENPELNLLAFINPATHEVEYVQFATATPGVATSPFQTRYTISTLLRGRVSTDYNVASHSFADDVVVIDSSVKPRRMNVFDIGRDLNYKFQTPGQSLDLLPVVTQRLYGTSIRPLPPSNLRGERDSDDNLLILWNRRSRVGAGMIPGSDVPLGEEREEYEVTIPDASPSRSWRVITGMAIAALLEGNGATKFENIDVNTLTLGGAGDTRARSLQQITQSGNFAEATLIVAGTGVAGFGFIPSSGDWTGGASAKAVASYYAEMEETPGPGSTWTLKFFLGGVEVYSESITQAVAGAGIRVRLTLSGSEVRYTKNWTGDATPPQYIAPIKPSFPLKVLAQVNLFPGNIVKQVVMKIAPQPATIYTADQMTEDGLTPGDPVTVQVQQISAIVGAGPAAERDL